MVALPKVDWVPSHQINQENTAQAAYSLIEAILQLRFHLPFFQEDCIVILQLKKEQVFPLIEMPCT